MSTQTLSQASSETDALEAAGADVASPAVAAEVVIARDIVLSLPRKPGFPENRLLFQTLVARYEGRTRAFQATVSLSADRAEIVLLAPSGPRILKLDWTEDGIVETRSNLAPDDLDSLNILADIFLTIWPKDAVNAALSNDGVLLTGGDDREIWRNEDRVIDLQSDGVDDHGRHHSRLVHIERGYVLDIISEDLGAS